MKRLIILFFAVSIPYISLAALQNVWETHTPRAELEPWSKEGDVLTIFPNGRKGAVGQWQATFPVKGGQHYRFSAIRKTWDIDIQNVQRHIVERLIWLDADGNKVKRDEPTFSSYRPGTAPRAEPEFPRVTGAITRGGWVEVLEVFKAPKAATQVKVELSSVGWMRAELVGGMCH